MQGKTDRSDGTLTLTDSSVPLVQMSSIWKVFDGVPVLQGIDVDLRAGEVHALFGGNGSGKSTTMKILSGVYKADSGEIFVNGEKAYIESPTDAHKIGIYMVPQEPHIFPHLSVEENLLTGLDGPKSELRERVRQMAEEMEFKVSLSSSAGSLSIANQQLLEIIRGLLRDVNVLILDEPTSALTFREVERLFDKIRVLKERGIGVFFISHRLGEILEISQRVTALRNGVVVLNELTENLSPNELVKAVFPERSEAEEKSRHVVQEPGRKPPSESGEPVLKVENLSSEAFDKVSLSVNAGEVVGLAGLVGAGRTELAEAIVGIDEHAEGKVYIDGHLVKNRSPRTCQDFGLVYVPEDRHAHGIFLDLPHLYTTTASILPDLGKIFISFSKERAIGQDYMNRLKIKANSLYQLARTLSGGNQQKVVLSKALASSPKCIILDEPTRGVDTRAREDVYELIGKLKAQGVGILLISSEMEEIVEFSDRVVVMYQGMIIKRFSKEEITLERVMEASFGMVGEQTL